MFDESMFDEVFLIFVRTLAVGDTSRESCRFIVYL